MIGRSQPLWVLALLDIALWGAVSTTAGYVGHRWPAQRLARDGRLTRLRRFETRGRVYERSLHIKRWKDRLPEAGALFTGGFAKRDLRRRDPAHLRRFVLETRRAELVHWAILAAGPLFGIWNPPWLAAAMVLYGLAANLPCIVIQRYNRARLSALLG